MRKTVPLDIVGGTSFDRYSKQSIEETYNMMISDGALVPYAGYQKRLLLQADGEARECYVSTKFDRLIVIIGQNIYEVDDDFGFSRIGSLESASGPVFISENEADQLAFVEGSSKIYIYTYTTGSSSFEKIDLADSTQIGSNISIGYITFQDTYFIIPDTTTNNWYISANNNGKQWSALDRASLQTKPDVMVAAVAFDRQLFIMGKKVSEIWHDVGNPLFPYQRSNSISIDYGCLSASTIAVGFGMIVWLAANAKSGATIIYSNGGPPKTISTDGIDFLLDKLDDSTDSSAFLFQEDSHVFYQITFKHDNFTLVYDFNEEKFYTLTDERMNFHIARRVAFFDNKHYFVSYRDAALYEMSTDFSTYKYDIGGTNLGDEIPRIRITKRFATPSSRRFKVNWMNLTLEQGNSKEEQKVALSIARNGGMSFGTVQTKTLFPLGQRPNKFDFWLLGAANDMVFQVQFWGKTRFVVLNGVMEVEQ